MMVEQGVEKEKGDGVRWKIRWRKMDLEKSVEKVAVERIQRVQNLSIC